MKRIELDVTEEFKELTEKGKDLLLALSTKEGKE